MIVEGNSFLEYIEPDFAIMCARAGENKVKSSARRNLQKADALYLSTIDNCDRKEAIERFENWQRGLSIELNTDGLWIATRYDIAKLIDSISEHVSIGSSRAKLCSEPSEMAAEYSHGRKPGDRQPSF